MEIIVFWYIFIVKAQVHLGVEVLLLSDDVLQRWMLQNQQQQMSQVWCRIHSWRSLVTRLWSCCSVVHSAACCSTGSYQLTTATLAASAALPTTDSPDWLSCLMLFLTWFRYVHDLYNCTFGALTLLVGQQEGHPACKNWVVGCWHSYLSGTRCRLAYGPADATATHCLLLQ